MSFIDQGAGKPKEPDVALAVFYRRGPRGVVAQVLPITDGFEVPEGWHDTPDAVEWKPDEEPILAYQPELDDGGLKRARVKAAD